MWKLHRVVRRKVARWRNADLRRARRVFANGCCGYVLVSNGSRATYRARPTPVMGALRPPPAPATLMIHWVQVMVVRALEFGSEEA